MLQISKMRSKRRSKPRRSREPNVPLPCTTVATQTSHELLISIIWIRIVNRWWVLGNMFHWLFAIAWSDRMPLLDGVRKYDEFTSTMRSPNDSAKSLHQRPTRQPFSNFASQATSNEDDRFCKLSQRSSVLNSPLPAKASTEERLESSPREAGRATVVIKHNSNFPIPFLNQAFEFNDSSPRATVFHSNAILTCACPCSWYSSNRILKITIPPFFPWNLVLPSALVLSRSPAGQCPPRNCVCSWSRKKSWKQTLRSRVTSVEKQIQSLERFYPWIEQLKPTVIVCRLHIPSYNHRGKSLLFLQLQGLPFQFSHSLPIAEMPIIMSQIATINRKIPLVAPSQIPQ